MSSLIFSELNLIFLDFTVHQDSYVIKYNQITIAYEIKDTERYIHRKEEDEKYNIILVNRRHKNESVKMKRKVEDNLLRNIKKMIKDKELVSNYKILYDM